MTLSFMINNSQPELSCVQSKKNSDENNTTGRYRGQ